MTRAAPWLGDWRRPAAIIAGAAVALALPPFLAGGFTLHLLTTGLYYTILAASWNLLAGIGSGVVVAAVFGLALGRMVLSMRAIYLAIATWAFAETIHILLTAAYPITRGELGLNVPPLFHNLDPTAYYALFAALTIVSVTIMYGIVKSPIGYFMRAIRDDDLRAESLGVDTTRVKVFVFTVASAFAGLAGAFYGHYLVVLSPQMADFNEMAKLIIMVVLGGLGTVLGPLIGAAPVQILTTYLQKYGEWDLVIFAVVVIALMRTHVGGIAAFVYAGLARLTSRSKVAPSP
jgi:branched-chain amino acid transport system permease protein